MKNRAKELIIEHKLERGDDLDKTILRKTSQECSVSTRLLTKIIDMVIMENVNEQEESKGAKKLDDMFDSETNSVDVDQSEGLQNGDEGKQSNDEAAGAIVKDQETSSPGQELETKENVESVQNEASIHSQLEMSDESESELCIDAGDSQTSPKKSVMSSKKASKELNENLDLNDYWMKELKKDKNWKNQDSFEVLITDITNKRSKPAFARVVALGRIELGLHDDVSKIVSSDMLKFILKCHEENQFSAMETKIQQLIKGMDFNYLFLIVMKSAEIAVYRI